MWSNPSSEEPRLAILTGFLAAVVASTAICVVSYLDAARASSSRALGDLRPACADADLDRCPGACGPRRDAVPRAPRLHAVGSLSIQSTARAQSSPSTSSRPLPLLRSTSKPWSAPSTTASVASPA